MENYEKTPSTPAMGTDTHMMMIIGLDIFWNIIKDDQDQYYYRATQYFGPQYGPYHVVIYLQQTRDGALRVIVYRDHLKMCQTVTPSPTDIPIDELLIFEELSRLKLSRS